MATVASDMRCKLSCIKLDVTDLLCLLGMHVLDKYAAAHIEVL